MHKCPFTSPGWDRPPRMSPAPLAPHRGSQQPDSAIILQTRVPYAAHIVQVTTLPRTWHFKGMKEDNISKDRCPAGPLTLHVLQV